MSVSSAAVGSPLPRATSTIARASSRALSRSGRNAPEPTLTSMTSASRPGGQLLGQDRADDQRDRLDGPGGVADRVQPPVGRGQAGGLADDRAARTRARRARRRSDVGRDVVARDRLELVQRAAGVAEPAAGDHRHRRRRRRRRSAPAAGSPCPRRRRSSACRAPGRSARRRPTPARRPSASSRRSARRARPAVMPAQEDRHRQRADLGVAHRAVGDPGHQLGDLVGATAPRRRACGG